MVNSNPSTNPSQASRTGLCYLMSPQIKGKEVAGSSVTDGNRIYHWHMKFEKPAFPYYNGKLNASAQVDISAIRFTMDNSTCQEVVANLLGSGTIVDEITLVNLKNTGSGSTALPAFKIILKKVKIVHVKTDVTHDITGAETHGMGVLVSPHDQTQPPHHVPAVIFDCVADQYEWTYIPYDTSGKAQGNVAYGFDTTKNIAI